jgi:hypothetical protein
MNLEKYTGVIPDGEYTVRVTKVEAVKSKAGNDMLVFYGHFIDLNVDQKWQYPLLPTTTYKLKGDLEAAECLRDGNSYSDSLSEMAQEIQSDIGNRNVIVEVTPQKNSSFQNFRIKGVDLG